MRLGACIIWVGALVHSLGQQNKTKGAKLAVGPKAAVRLRRAARFARTRVRELRMIVKALASTKHPILVHIIPMRRCNLACTYCNEFDDVSTPVPLEEMKPIHLPRPAKCGVSFLTWDWM